MAKRIAVLCSGMRGYVLTEHLQAIASPGFTIEPVTSLVPHTPYTPYDLAVLHFGYLEAAVRAERDGYDAVLIDAFPDYGLNAIKSALNIPVVGAGQATMTLATMLGRRFSIVTVWPRSFEHLYHSHLKDCGLSDHCASIRFIGDEQESGLIGTDQSVMRRMHRGDDSVTDAVAAECRRAAAEDGADSIVFGCTCMTPIGPAVASACPIPVLECSRVGYATLEALVKLGIRQSKAAFPAPRPDDLERVSQIIAGAAVQQNAPECDVCILAER